MASWKVFLTTISIFCVLSGIVLAEPGGDKQSQKQQSENHESKGTSQNIPPDGPQGQLIRGPNPPRQLPNSDPRGPNIGGPSDGPRGQQQLIRGPNPVKQPGSENRPTNRNGPPNPDPAGPRGGNQSPNSAAQPRPTGPGGRPPWMTGGSGPRGRFGGNPNQNQPRGPPFSPRNGRGPIGDLPRGFGGPPGRPRQNPFGRNGQEPAVEVTTQASTTQPNDKNSEDNPNDTNSGKIGQDRSDKKQDDQKNSGSFSYSSSSESSNATSRESVERNGNEDKAKEEDGDKKETNAVETATDPAPTEQTPQISSSGDLDEGQDGSGDEKYQSSDEGTPGNQQNVENSDKNNLATPENPTEPSGDPELPIGIDAPNTGDIPGNEGPTSNEDLDYESIEPEDGLPNADENSEQAPNFSDENDMLGEGEDLADGNNDIGENPGPAMSLGNQNDIEGDSNNAGDSVLASRGTDDTPENGKDPLVKYVEGSGAVDDFTGALPQQMNTNDVSIDIEHNGRRRARRRRVIPPLRRFGPRRGSLRDLWNNNLDYSNDNFDDDDFGLPIVPINAVGGMPLPPVHRGISEELESQTRRRMPQPGGRQFRGLNRRKTFF
ncbi:hypothetical protein DdX_06938 [Ditylenchus destructor]|uniref:Uncharacterized protein n=1 Tax=Ditylenchus destructor TaxID=166010 RepID=A0AAD4N8F7_9BILA|nr:hypothetical protein DdX_06938 [Ditylenchus destructor]